MIYQSTTMCLILLGFLWSQSSNRLHAQTPPRKLAFIVGVSEYSKDGLTDLTYAHKDANDLATELASHGFEVTKLIGDQAGHKSVRSSLDQFVKLAGQLSKKDVVLVSFSGHGVQKTVKQDSALAEIPFFCVYDTMVNDPATMISLNSVVEKLKEKSGCSSNLLIVDACRNNPDKGARTLDGSTVRELPTKISMLFSSSPGQKSFESEKVKQGIFTHVLLKGLRGDAANSRGQIQWGSLAAYVAEEVPLMVGELLEDQSVKQVPNLVSNMVRSPILVRKGGYTRLSPSGLRAPFSTREASVTQSSWAAHLNTESITRAKNGHQMVLIPPGEFQMGNDEPIEQIIDGFSFLKGVDKAWFDDAPPHRVEITQPFWMSSTEVTVGQFRSFVQATGYKTEAERDGKGGEGYDSRKHDNVGDPKYTWKNTGFDQTDRHPVVNVSWNDAMQYSRWLSQETGDKYGLPTEAQWEYACRAGTRSRFHFGNEPNELVQWENSWDTSTKQQFPQKNNQLAGIDEAVFSAPVGQTSVNPFGLHDLHGNVSEWCNDIYDPNYYKISPAKDPQGPERGDSRVLRGGSWGNIAVNCRAASRYVSIPAFRSNQIGFRVVLNR